jgi:DNA-binding transcriptional MerR regulator
LLKFVSETRGGYRLYDKKWSLKRIKHIQQLQKTKRLTIPEIRRYFK